MNKQKILIFSLVLNFASMVISIFAGLAVGTQILTPAGQVPIETLRVGDIVTGYDFDNNTYPAVAIKEINLCVSTDMYSIITDHGFVQASADQAFYDAFRDECIDAQFLQPGDCLFSKDLAEIKCTKIEGGPPTAVYDITLDAPHLFFSSDDCLLTHNFVAAVPAVVPIIEAITGLGGIVVLVSLTKTMSSILSVFQGGNMITNGRN